MAKQKVSPKAKRQAKPAVPERPPAQPDAQRRRASSEPASAPSQRPTYLEAVALYERGVDALQHHDYQTALERLESVLRLYPEEKELHERVRLYLNVCRRHAAPREAGPQTIEERLFASTLALNGGRYSEAISLLRLVRDEDPDNDHALYMLAVAHAQRGEHAEAIAHLERAIALNPENRALARRDADLEPISDDDAFRAALEAPSLPPAESRPRRPVKTRSAR